MRTTILALIFVLVPASSRAQETELLNLSDAGFPGISAGVFADISPDGRYVVFCGFSNNLVPGDTNGKYDLFLRDLQVPTTTRLTLGPGNVEADNHTFDQPEFSGNGQFVVFSSSASNLDPTDANGSGSDVFIVDLTTGVVQLVSTNAAGNSVGGGSNRAHVSDDGRYVSFLSNANGLVPNDTNSATDVFVKDRFTGQVERANTDAGGAQTSGAVSWNAISPDGNLVAFTSSASTLAPGDTNGIADVWIKDRTTGAVTNAGLNSYGGLAVGGDFAMPAFSGNGRFLAFASSSTMFPGDGGGADIFVRDLLTGSFQHASVALGGAVQNGSASEPSLSHDGLTVVFVSTASNLVPGDTNNVSDVFVRDIVTGVTTRVSTSTDGVQANALMWEARQSADGKLISFSTNASNLVPGDVNLASDVFLHRRAADGTTFCSGDGTATPCPCANAGAPGRGCQNSNTTGGAGLSATGRARLSAETWRLQVVGMPATASCLFFQGTDSIGAGAGAVFGDGLRCAGGAVLRLATRFAVNGAASYPEAGDVPISVRGAIPAAGGERTYQAWYRNVAAYCTPDPFNLSNGLRVTWTP